jgi:predicted dehydrogenase
MTDHTTPQNAHTPTKSVVTRRDFVKSSAALSAAATIAPFAFAARRQDADVIRIGVIGCGGRGTGAAVDALDAHPATRIVALADLYADRLHSSLSNLQGIERAQGRLAIPEEHRFTGFDAYRKLLAIKEVDYVILATPPGFRPTHFEAAVNAGKHVFMEKPVAVDPAGIRRVLAASTVADEKGLNVVAGTQRRHHILYQDIMQRIHDGQIGELVSANCYWNQGGLWVHNRKPEYTDMEWQTRNWLYFAWLSGDHICEQHVHNIDVINWAMQSTPVKCTGMGGREVRTGSEYGHIFDHFAVEYEYANGARLLSMCRQIDGCANRVEEYVRGTKGFAATNHGAARLEAPGNSWRFQGKAENPYVVEHRDLIAAITGSSRINEARNVAESTLTAIMGRMSAYSGQEITWDAALKSPLDLTPATLAFGPLPVEPVAIPGKTRYV